jgi:tetratricopeptide (TPR) repeat protein
MDWKYVYTKGIPIEAQYLYQKALELSKTERYESALRYFRQAVVIAPRYAKAICQMGDCLEKLGRYNEAVAFYERTLSIDPLNTDAQAKMDILTTAGKLNGTQFPSRERQPLNGQYQMPI